MSSFNMMGMNLGVHYADYTLLHGRPTFTERETVEALSNEYTELCAAVSILSEASDATNVSAIITRSDFPATGRELLASTNASDIRTVREILIEARDKVGQKLLSRCAIQDRINFDPQNAVLAKLFFDQGLDLVEAQFANRNRANVEQFIDGNLEPLFRYLNERVTDKYGAARMREQYPQLCRYLNQKYNSQLPKNLQIGIIDSIIAAVKNFFSRRPTISPHDRSVAANPVSNRMQQIKDRLSENFFRRVISSPDRPAVVTLQEVGAGNRRALNVLEEGNYAIYRPRVLPRSQRGETNNNTLPDQNSDTAIAIDRTRFEDIREYVLPSNTRGRTLAVAARDKQTGEEFIFVSVHIPGYDISPDALATPDDQASTENDFNRDVQPYVQNLQRLIEELKSANPNSRVVLQGDFNTFPEYFVQTAVPESMRSENIFKILGKVGLTLHRTGSPTEWNPQTPGFERRELDYAMTSGLAGRVSILEEPNDQELSLAQVGEGRDRGNIHFDPMLLFSDHRPIWMQIRGRNEANQEERPPPASSESS